MSRYSFILCLAYCCKRPSDAGKMGWISIQLGETFQLNPIFLTLILDIFSLPLWIVNTIEYIVCIFRQTEPTYYVVIKGAAHLLMMSFILFSLGDFCPKSQAHADQLINESFRSLNIISMMKGWIPGTMSNSSDTKFVQFDSSVWKISRPKSLGKS